MRFCSAADAVAGGGGGGICFGESLVEPPSAAVVRPVVVELPPPRFVVGLLLLSVLVAPRMTLMGISLTFSFNESLMEGASAVEEEEDEAGLPAAPPALPG